MSALPLSHVLAVQRPTSHVVSWRGVTQLTFANFRRDVCAAAARVRRQRLERAALVCRDAYWFAVGLYALFAADAEVVIPPSAQPALLRELADSFETLVTDDEDLSDFVLAPGASDAATLAPLEPGRCRLSIFTSGSTARPKRVQKTLAQFEHEAAILERCWGQELSGAPVAATVSHQHVYGLTFRVFWPLAAGRPFAATTHALWEDVLAELPGGAALITSPTHLLRLAGLSRLRPEARPRTIFTAGAPLPYSAARETSEIFGALPTEIYGSTETGALATRCQHDERTPWQSLPGVEISCVHGRLCVRSPSVDPDRRIETEDLVQMFPEGGFALLGRADRIVKIEGKRVSLAEIEETLIGSELVKDAAAVALPGPSSVLAAAVVLTAEGRAELAARGQFRFSRLLRSCLSARLETIAMPRRWRFVETIPCVAMGKRQPAAIAALFAGPDHG
jgi:acyl-coenzyme A synthetase/AMP-(fatty) acid ligase